MTADMAGQQPDPRALAREALALLDTAREGLENDAERLKAPAAISLRDDPFDDDDPFAELNNLSDVIAADTSGPVRHSATPPSPREVAVGSAGSYIVIRRSGESGRSSTRGSAGSIDDDEIDVEPTRRSITTLLLFALGLTIIIVAGLLRGLNLFGLGIATLSWGLIWFAGSIALTVLRRPPSRLRPPESTGSSGAATDIQADSQAAAPAPERAQTLQARGGPRITRKLDETMRDASVPPRSAPQVAPQRANVPPGIVAQPLAAAPQGQTFVDLITSVRDIAGLRKIVFRLVQSAEGARGGPYQEVELILDEVEKQPDLKKNICAILSSFTGDTSKLIFPLTTALVTGLVAGQAALMLTPLGIATFAVIVAGAGVKVFCGGKGGDD